MKNILSKRGQNLTEIVLLIGIVSLVFIGMEVYFKRGLNGRVKDLTDSLIGKKQAAYQQDTSGLKINTSVADSVFNSTATVEEVSGGGKSLQSTENSNVDYSSTTEDDTE